MSIEERVRMAAMPGGMSSMPPICLTKSTWGLSNDLPWMPTMSSMADASPTAVLIPVTISHAPMLADSRALWSRAVSMRDSAKPGIPRTTSSPKLVRYSSLVPKALPNSTALGCTMLWILSMKEERASDVLSTEALRIRDQSCCQWSPRSLTFLSCVKHPQKGSPYDKATFSSAESVVSRMASPSMLPMSDLSIWTLNQFSRNTSTSNPSRCPEGCPM
mmetsp:Transcript_51363/g.127886  ORF Transcript_51363/g.127886 Transcript_51363/m.127886 type:complete len:218 (-) Transcript_51363:53-706(-)